VNCSEKISKFLEPIIEKRKYFEANSKEVKEILSDGEQRGRSAAQETMKQVRDAMKFG
jgi:tryptophanyl-tRNA synthetase